MTLLPDALRFLSVFCAGIAAGTWVVTQLALIPAQRELGEASAITLLRVTEKGIVRYNPLCATASTVAGLLLLTLRIPPAGRAALLTTIGCLAALASTLISMLWNMPLRRRIAGGPPGSIPAGYPESQRRWNRGNLARMVLGLVAFAGYLLATL